MIPRLSRKHLTILDVLVLVWMIRPPLRVELADATRVRVIEAYVDWMVRALDGLDWTLGIWDLAHLASLGTIQTES